MVRSTSQQKKLINSNISAVLEEVADLLEGQGTNPYRVHAYRAAAVTVRKLKGPVHLILDEEGVVGLTELPTIGSSIAHAIEQLVHSGLLPLLERLRGEDAAEHMFATVPDIGPGLAHRIHAQLGIETLVELEVAANDGRLAKVPGMGEKRIRAVRESLAGRFGRRRHQTSFTEEQDVDEQVSVGELLDIDDQYRRLARLVKMLRTAPLRFNPIVQAWLPILHTQRGGRQYTACFPIPLELMSWARRTIGSSSTAMTATTTDTGLSSLPTSGDCADVASSAIDKMNAKITTRNLVQVCLL